METETPTPTNAIRHGACGRWWTGSRVAHCGRCHHHFSGTSAFDRHWTAVTDGQDCRKPDEVGLVAVDKPYGTLWSWPNTGRNPHGATAVPADTEETSKP